MASRLRLRTLGILIPACLAAAPAFAAETLALRYEAFWGGFHAADIVLAVNEGNPSYRTGFEVKTRGAVKWLMRLTVDAQSRGLSSAAGLTPQSYRTYYTTRRGERLVGVDFDPLTRTGRKVLDETWAALEPTDDDSEEVPPVPPELRTDVVDPLSGILLIRDKVAAALAGGPTRFTVAAFDGRRRFDLTGDVVGPGRHDIAGRDYDTVDLKLTMKPVAGFKKKHLAHWDGSQYDVYLDRDLLLPLKIATDSFRVSTVINIIETCPPSPACSLAATE